MQTFDQAIYKLYVEELIDYDTAISYAESKNNLRLIIKLNKGMDDGGFDDEMDGLMMDQSDEDNNSGALF